MKRTLHPVYLGLAFTAFSSNCMEQVEIPSVKIKSEDGTSSANAKPDLLKYLDVMGFIDDSNHLRGADSHVLQAMAGIHTSPKLTQGLRETALKAHYSRHLELTEIAHWAVTKREKLNANLLLDPDRLVEEFLKDKKRYPTILANSASHQISVPSAIYEFYPFSSRPHRLTERGMQARVYSPNSYKLESDVQPFSLALMREALCLMYNYLTSPKCKTKLKNAGQDEELIKVLLRMLMYFKSFEKMDLKLDCYELLKLSLDLDLPAFTAAIISYLHVNHLVEKIAQQIPTEWYEKLLGNKWNNSFVIRCLSQRLKREGDNSALLEAADVCIGSLVKSCFLQKVTFTRDFKEALNFPTIADRLKMLINGKYRLGLLEVDPRPTELNGSAPLASFSIQGKYQLIVSHHGADTIQAILFNSKDGSRVGFYEAKERCMKAILLNATHSALVADKKVIILRIDPASDVLSDGTRNILKECSTFSVHELSACESCESEDALIIADRFGINKFDFHGKQLESYTKERLPIQGVATQGALVLSWQADGTLSIFDKDGVRAKVKIDEAPIHSAGFLDDDTILLSLKDKGLRLLDLSGAVIKKLISDEKNETALTWTSINDIRVAVGYANGFVYIWDFNRGKVGKRIVPPSEGARPLSMTTDRGTLYISYSTGEVAKEFLQKYASATDLLSRICVPEEPAMMPRDDKEAFKAFSRRKDTTATVTLFVDQKEYRMDRQLYNHCKLLGLISPQEVHTIRRAKGEAIGLMNSAWSENNVADLFASDPKKASALTTDIIHWAISQREVHLLHGEPKNNSFKELPMEDPVVIKSHDGHFSVTPDRSVVGRFLKIKNPLVVCKQMECYFSLFVFRELLYLLANKDYVENVTGQSWKENDEQLMQSMVRLLEHYAGKRDQANSSYINPFDRFSIGDLLYLAQEFEVPYIAHAAVTYVRSMKTLNGEVQDIVDAMTPQLAKLLERNQANRPLLFMCLMLVPCDPSSGTAQDLKKIMQKCAASFVDFLSRDTVAKTPFFIKALKAEKHASHITDELQIMLIEKFNKQDLEGDSAHIDPFNVNGLLREVLHLLITGANGQPKSLFPLTDPLIAFSHEDGTVTVWDRAAKKKLDTITLEGSLRIEKITAEDNMLTISYTNGTHSNHVLAVKQKQGRQP